MKKLEEVIKNPSGFDSLANYMGDTEFGDLYVVLTRSRDSGTLEESNFRSALQLLGDEGDNVVIHRFGHWACGWWEALTVRGGTKEYVIAENILKNLETYPVVDEQDYSDLQCERGEE